MTSDLSPSDHRLLARLDLLNERLLDISNELYNLVETLSARDSRPLITDYL